VKAVIKNSVLVLLLLISAIANANQQQAFSEADTLLLQLSERLLYRVKIQEPVDEIEKKLNSFAKKDLKKGLPDDAAKKTFWLNMYNAWFQLLAARGWKNPDIFNQQLIYIAGMQLSLEEIEQGILRKDYRRLQQADPLFKKKKIEALAVHNVDYRIHFALNCGAKSCPPIAFYTYSQIEKQLDLATRNYVKNTTAINDTLKTITISPLMDWYKNDFGGDTGIRIFLQVLLQKNFEGYAISYTVYNWKEDLRNFADAKE
jgi:Protein of unknown function, DUF547